MRNRALTLGRLMLALVLLAQLAGCVQSGGEVTVHRDGSIDMKLRVELDERTRSLLGNAGEAAIDDLLAENGPPLTKTEHDGVVEYSLIRSYGSYSELRDSMREGSATGVLADASRWVEVAPRQTDHFLYSTYSVRIQLKSNNYMERVEAQLNGLGAGGSVAKLLLRRFVFDFTLNLPFDLARQNNADEDRGRSLTWHIRPADPAPMELTVLVPNVARIAWTAGITLVVVIGGTVWLVVRRRRTRKNT